jgi:hypothetical protein
MLFLIYQWLATFSLAHYSRKVKLNYILINTTSLSAKDKAETLNGWESPFWIIQTMGVDSRVDLRTLAVTMLSCRLSAGIGL